MKPLVIVCAKDYRQAESVCAALRKEGFSVEVETGHWGLGVIKFSYALPPFYRFCRIFTENYNGSVSDAIKVSRGYKSAFIL